MILLTEELLAMERGKISNTVGGGGGGRGHTSLCNQIETPSVKIQGKWDPLLPGGLFLGRITQNWPNKNPSGLENLRPKTGLILKMRPNFIFI
jgi:hypothetical protein